ncbi:MAG: 6-phosphogluconolactonase [Kiloniellales bacterium]|nr:6-phosphogluconolactonase [Kiloniellales bacterium]
MKLRVFSDAESVARHGAALIADAARGAVKERGRFVLAASGGRTPWLMFRALADEPVPWEAVHIVQVDERITAADDPVRNLAHLRDALLAHAPVPPENLHAMPVEADDLAAAGAAYARTLEALAGTPPRIDLVHLGLGPDGHTASLVPGDPVLEVADQPVGVSGPYQGHRRMTLTYPALDRAGELMFVVTGAEKAAALARLVQHDPAIPAGRIRAARAVVIADRAAAGELHD